MRFFVRLLKSAVCSICILGMMATFAAAPSWADDCGSGDRVDLPDCVALIYGRDGASSKYVEIKNACSAPVTLKFDIRSGGDKRVTFDSKMTYFDTVSWDDGYLRAVKCCPRYNSCSFPGERAF